MRTLYLITARGGSKGIPEKNIRKLGSKPLIYYSIDLARKFTTDDNICVSTDDNKIIDVVEKRGLKVPFSRPKKLATDTASSNDVIVHALNWYEKKGIYFDAIVLLQPTSPFRLKTHLKKALALFSDNIDMVVSVLQLTSNPYATLYKKSSKNLIAKVIPNKNAGTRRQDSEPIYEINGAIYVINVNSLKNKKMSDFTKLKKVEMDILNSVDIDVPTDWKWCEFILQNQLIKFDY
jgi:CMP-N,N'-diacetyllegionaminic acid synthase